MEIMLSLGAGLAGFCVVTEFVLHIRKRKRHAQADHSESLLENL